MPMGIQNSRFKKFGANIHSFCMGRNTFAKKELTNVRNSLASARPLRPQSFGQVSPTALQGLHLLADMPICAIQKRVEPNESAFGLVHLFKPLFALFFLLVIICIGRRGAWGEAEPPWLLGGFFYQPIKLPHDYLTVNIAIGLPEAL